MRCSDDIRKLSLSVRLLGSLLMHVHLLHEDILSALPAVPMVLLIPTHISANGCMKNLQSIMKGRGRKPLIGPCMSMKQG